MVLPWFLCGVLTTVVLALLVKIRRLHTSLDEIGTQLGERLSQDTNTLISLSSGDRHARRLAAELNRQLRLLRRQLAAISPGGSGAQGGCHQHFSRLRTPLTCYLRLSGAAGTGRQVGGGGAVSRHHWGQGAGA